MRIHSKSIFLLSILLLSFVLILISSRRADVLLTVREKAYVIIGTLQMTSSNLKTGFTEFITDMGRSEKLREENRALKNEIAQMRFKEENYYQEIVSSYQKLEEMLEFKEKHSYDLLPAQVIAYPSYSYFKTVFINRGEKEGIEKDLVVVNSQGLVGRIVEVYPHQAKVLLILDERSKVGVRDQESRDVAILQGKGEKGVCELKYLLNKALIELGDRVITSGLGGIFPEGILVGKVSHVRKNPRRLFQEVEVAPSVDFGKLEELFIIKK
ncbi:hypothetical protein LCGC14_1738440, partial [marine sediment metagenome]